MANVLKKPELIIAENGFCPGCGHSTMAKLLCDVFEETGVADIAIGAAAVGCGWHYQSDNGKRLGTGAARKSGSSSGRNEKGAPR